MPFGSLWLPVLVATVVVWSLRGILDAVIYAVLTGLVFRFFWPAA
jgi:hypothetical protein